MADNRQLAFVLALVGGLAALANAVISILVMTVFASFVGGSMGSGAGPFWWSVDGPGMFTGLFAMLAIVFAGVAVATGIVMLVAAPRLRSDDPETRRTWAIWCIVAGGVSLVGAGGILSGALGVGAGVVTLMSDQDARASP